MFGSVLNSIDVDVGDDDDTEVVVGICADDVKCDGLRSVGDNDDVLK